jgi:hypothetical protein
VDNLVNLTRFSTAAMPSVHKDGEELLLVVIAGAFRLPAPGRMSVEALAIDEEQPPVHESDQYWGEPGRSSLRYEGQTAYAKPGTDIHLLGHAWAPRGHLVRQAMAGIQVGAWGKLATVFGERRWNRGSPSAPEAFERIELRYERCFGGPSGPGPRPLMEASERNPIGCGLVSSAEAADQPLPNLEDPRALIRSAKDLPEPVGFGPIARHWLPRRRYSGTYDETWVRTRAPHWPDDLDERFFCAAPGSLCAIPHLRGGEPVVVTGCHPDGEFRFNVPSHRFRVRVDLRGRLLETRPVLDGLIVEPDKGCCTAIWRSYVRIGKDLAALVSIVARELESWEEAA